MVECFMVLDGDLETKSSSAMSSELPQQDADETLAKDVAEQLHQAWVASGFTGYVTTEPTLTANVIAWACKMFYARHRSEHVLPHIVPDPFVHKLSIMFRAY